MFVSVRTVLLLVAAMASAAVAPAQVITGKVTPVSASMITQASLPSPTSGPLAPTALAPTALDPPAAIQGTAIGDIDQQNAAEIKTVPGETLLAMVSRLGSRDAASRERACLATAIYFEAKSEPLAGQLAVGEVLANRVRSGRFASSFCGVVMQRGQFSFIHNGSLPHVSNGAQWRNAMGIAAIVEGKLMNSSAPRALFFHAKRVSPSWHATRVATIGNHVFYR